MNRVLSIFLLSGIVFFMPPVMAQQEAVINNSRAVAVGEEVHITFDILGNSKMIYEVWVEISDREGSKINARSFTGDVGSQVKGGNHKLIIWSPAEDGIFLDEDINLKVKANYNSVEVEKEFSRGGLILQSTLVPGLGLSRYKGKPHWIKGAAAYGCLGGSIVFDRMAGENYSKYSEATDANDAANLIETARTQQNVSKGLAYTALAIWVTDLIWTVVGTSDLNAGLGAGFDPVTGIPILSFTIPF